MVQQLNGVHAGPLVRAAARAAWELRGVEDFEPPEWETLANVLRLPTREPDSYEPGMPSIGNNMKCLLEWNGFAARG